MIHLGSLDDLIVEVDENQATVQSFGAISVDTQDSAIFETSPLQCGNIRFIKDAYDSQGYQVMMQCKLTLVLLNKLWCHA